MKRHRGQTMRAACLATLLWMGGLNGAWAGISHVDLNGAWEVSEARSNDWFAATVPGCVHMDLLAAKRIPDPYYRDNESKLQWISDRTWTYRRTFIVNPDLLEKERVLLRCDGLDTLASVLINGEEAGRSDNMFRTWEFDVKRRLKAGTNSIEIQFEPVLPVIRAKEKSRPLPTYQYRGAGYIRKTPSNFGWDWGPTLVTCGIWKNISLMGIDAARIGDVQVLQDHSKAGEVGLTLRVNADPPSINIPLKAAIEIIGPVGKSVGTAKCDFEMDRAEARVSIANPELWWPAGMGKQPLYTIAVKLTDKKGDCLDETSRRIGLRTLRAHQKGDQKPMQLVVNGIPFFAKGANWIPADVFPNRVTKEILRRYVADAVAANMNSLRFWGGGNYEQDELFDLCDEMGVCVWMDFKFACSTYPSFDPAFLESVRQEARDNVKRLRHHPSIALWCGNNEVVWLRGKEWAEKTMSEADYYKLFRDTLGEVMRAHAPESDYVTGSPDCGDVHYWNVWHGGKPFAAYRGMHGFMSEFGFQAWPVPQTVESFTQPEDRTDVYSPIMKYHERSDRNSILAKEDGTKGTDKLMNILKLNFRKPKDFESTLWLSQINQAYGIEFAATGWRRDMPSSMGCIYWQYNDTWPGTSWSSVDYYGRWKALHYRARHFYAPVLVSADTDTNGTVTIWTTNDGEETRSTLRWQVTDLDGTVLQKDSKPVLLKQRASSRAASLDWRDLVARHGADRLLVWVSLEADGKTVSEALATFTSLRDLSLVEPHLQAELQGSGTNWAVSLNAAKPALWCWINLAGAEARYSDNFIHLKPGDTATINVQLQTPMTAQQVKDSLKVRSLMDTYR